LLFGPGISVTSRILLVVVVINPIKRFQERNTIETLAKPASDLPLSESHPAKLCKRGSRLGGSRLAQILRQ
jgi:hypothetical protein